MSLVNYELQDLGLTTSSVTGNVGQEVGELSTDRLTKVFVPYPGYNVKVEYFTINGYQPNYAEMGSNNEFCVRGWYNDQGENPGIVLHESIEKVEIFKYGCLNTGDPDFLDGQIAVRIVLKYEYTLPDSEQELLFITLDIDGDAQPNGDGGEVNGGGENNDNDDDDSDGDSTPGLNPNSPCQCGATPGSSNMNSRMIEVRMANGADSNCKVVFVPVSTNQSTFQPKSPTDPLENMLQFGANGDDYRQMVRFERSGCDDGSVQLQDDNDGLMGFFIVPKDGYTLSRHNLSIKTATSGGYQSSTSLLATETTNFIDATDPQTGEDYYDIIPKSNYNNFGVINRFDHIVKLGHQAENNSGDYFQPYTSDFPNFQSLIDFWTQGVSHNDLSFIENNIFRDNIEYMNGDSSITDSAVKQYFAATTYVNPIIRQREGFYWIWEDNETYIQAGFSNLWEDVNLSQMGSRNCHMYVNGWLGSSSGLGQTVDQNYLAQQGFNTGFHKDNWRGTSTNGSVVSAEPPNQYNYLQIDSGSLSGQYIELLPWSLSLVDVATGKSDTQHKAIYSGNEFSVDLGGPPLGPQMLSQEFPLYPSFFGYDWIDTEQLTESDGLYGINDTDNDDNDGGFPYVSNTSMIPDQYCASDFEGNFVAVVLSNLGNWTPGCPRKHLQIVIEGSAMPVDNNECVDYDIQITTD